MSRTFATFRKAELGFLGVEVKTRTAKYDRQVVTLTGGVREAAVNMADLVLHVAWAEDGESRVIHTKPSPYWEAKERGQNPRLPAEIPWPVGQSGYEVLRDLAGDPTLPDFTVAYFADNDYRSHEIGPHAALDVIARVDRMLGEAFEQIAEQGGVLSRSTGRVQRPATNIERASQVELLVLARRDDATLLAGEHPVTADLRVEVDVDLVGVEHGLSGAGARFERADLGQPLHAFDLATLRGPAVVVRRATPGERIVTLDGVSRTLTAEMTVICDAERPTIVAGVMGSAESEVTERTTDLVLECAYFQPTRIRPTRRALDLQSESSYRFERGIDMLGMPDALRRAVELEPKMAKAMTKLAYLASKNARNAECLVWATRTVELDANNDYALGLIGYSREQLGCFGTRDRGTCTNKLTISRHEVEGRVLSALQDKLMRKDFFEEFCREFAKEMNRLRMEQRAGLTSAKREVERIGRRIKKLLDLMLDDEIAVDEGKAEMKALDARRKELEAQLKKADTAEAGGGAAEKRAGRLRLLRTQVGAEEIAEVVSRATGIPVMWKLSRPRTVCTP